MVIYAVTSKDTVTKDVVIFKISENIYTVHNSKRQQ